MAEPVIMPKQGQSVESCIISKWHKQKGDKVEKGDLLFSYETDKASFEEEAPVSGILLDIFFEEGEDVPCLLNVCVIGQAGESAAEFNPNRKEADASAIHTKSAGISNPVSSIPSDTTRISDPVSHISLDPTRMPDSVTQVSQESASNQQPATSNPSDSARTMDPASRISLESTSIQDPASSIKISPRARNLADRLGIDYRYATPTGPYGRIIEQDIIALRDSGFAFTPAAREAQLTGTPAGIVQGTGLGGRITTDDLQKSLQDSGVSAVSAGTTPSAPVTEAVAMTEKPGAEQPQAPYEAVSITDPAYEEAKVPHIRKVIAKAMHQSLASTAQLTLNASFDATELLNYRKKLKEAKDRLGLENITLNDMILFAVSRTLPNHKALNAHFLEDKVRYFKNVNLGVAVDTDRGLMVPTVFGADLMSLNDISIQAKILAADCKAGTINPDLLKNGSFTVTNLGTLDIESFTPVLNPPQTGILGVNTIVQRAREVNGDYEFYPAMGLSLTFDHRAVDGAPAARFLKELKTNLENFSVMLAR